MKKAISRRSFLKGAAGVTGAVAASTVLGAPVLAAETQSGSEAEAGDSSFEQQKTDILAAIAEAELPTAEELESKEFSF